LLINRAFLTLEEKYKDLNKEHIGLIIHDECHNTPSDLCYNMLTYFNELKNCISPKHKAKNNKMIEIKITSNIF
jgi:hypothetical protein